MFITKRSFLLNITLKTYTENKIQSKHYEGKSDLVKNKAILLSIPGNYKLLLRITHFRKMCLHPSCGTIQSILKWFFTHNLTTFGFMHEGWYTWWALIVIHEWLNFIVTLMLLQRFTLVEKVLLSWHKRHLNYVVYLFSLLV